MYAVGEKYKIHSRKKISLDYLKSNEGYASFFSQELSEYYFLIFSKTKEMNFDPYFTSYS